MPDLALYHNDACSKCRATAALLAERGLQPRVVEYLLTPPDDATLRDLVGKLAIPARELLRKGEPEYAGLGLDDPTLPDDIAIAAMVAQPRLIERPILVRGERAVICRPPERALELVDGA
ncbi:arsenate reductase (glutaredoxin) [Solilutibacter silvestris]|uniref:Arsenate reductase n=1 Tax=Solilutibacter silvestris TaxID=1645665 RepID=A0A2K1PYE8_9GAMM|nr:arsenate reductase (glutaredoxin) [Lysobacter silvestris]PNS07822.1 arsC: arsenate reductase (glutaredoxin) [Lysobacter silvestris]